MIFSTCRCFSAPSPRGVRKASGGGVRARTWRPPGRFSGLCPRPGRLPAAGGRWPTRLVREPARRSCCRAQPSGRPAQLLCCPAQRLCGPTLPLCCPTLLLCCPTLPLCCPTQLLCSTAQLLCCPTWLLCRPLLDAKSPPPGRRIAHYVRSWPIRTLDTARLDGFRAQSGGRTGLGRPGRPARGRRYEASGSRHEARVKRRQAGGWIRPEHGPEDRPVAGKSRPGAVGCPKKRCVLWAPLHLGMPLPRRGCSGQQPRHPWLSI